MIKIGEDKRSRVSGESGQSVDGESSRTNWLNLKKLAAEEAKRSIAADEFLETVKIETAAQQRKSSPPEIAAARKAVQEAKKACDALRNLADDNYELQAISAIAAELAGERLAPVSLMADIASYCAEGADVVSYVNAKRLIEFLNEVAKDKDPARQAIVQEFLPAARALVAAKKRVAAKFAEKVQGSYPATIFPQSPVWAALDDYRSHYRDNQPHVLYVDMLRDAMRDSAFGPYKLVVEVDDETRAGWMKYFDKAGTPEEFATKADYFFGERSDLARLVNAIQEVFRWYEGGVLPVHKK